MWRALTVGLVAGLLVGCSGVGGPVAGAPAHHREHGFVNLNPDFARPPFWTRTRFFITRIFGTTFRPRTFDLAVVPNDGAALRANRTEPTVTWIGHATVLVQLAGLNVLTDPTWSDRTSPVSFGGPRRVTPPGVAFDDLPAIDLVLISHDHYDHLDLGTVRRLWAAHHPRFLVPLGLKAWFADLGIPADELDWWESRTIGGVTVTSVPVQHWSARTWGDQNHRLWTGWVMAGAERRFFFPGDTGYYAPIFQEIGRRLGPFDLAALPIGAYLPPEIMHLTHVTPEEALQVLEDLRGTRMLAVHWGTFDLAEEPFDDPPHRLDAEVQRRGFDPERVWVFRPGETRPW